MATDLLALIDGKPVPLTNCKWVLLDPAGCAYSSSHGGEFATADQAHRSWKPRQRDRDRQARAGWTVQLVTNEQWSADVAPCFYRKCDHAKAGA